MRTTRCSRSWPDPTRTLPNPRRHQAQMGRLQRRQSLSLPRRQTLLQDPPRRLPGFRHPLKSRKRDYTSISLT